MYIFRFKIPHLYFSKFNIKRGLSIYLYGYNILKLNCFFYFLIKKRDFYFIYIESCSAAKFVAKNLVTSPKRFIRLRTAMLAKCKLERTHLNTIDTSRSIPDRRE